MSLTAAVSPLLAPLRGTSWSGSVLATGRFGAYLSVPGAAVDVVPLLGVDAIALPTAVRLGVPFPHEALPLAVGDPVRLDDDGVTAAGANGAKFTGTSYTVTQRISATKTVTFRVGVTAVGTRLVYLLANPSANFDFTDKAWEALVGRAAQRVTQYQ